MLDAEDETICPSTSDMTTLFGVKLSSGAVVPPPPLLTIESSVTDDAAIFLCHVILQ